MKLFYREFGSGNPLIILHGLYGSNDNWIALAKSFSQSFRVIVPDLRNHGNSPQSDTHTYRAMTEDIIQLYDQAEIQRAHALGHSMGGKLALYFALWHPGFVDKVVVADVSPIPYHKSDNRFLSVTGFHKKLMGILSSISIGNISTFGEADARLQNDIKDEHLRGLILKNIRKTKKGMRWKINVPALHKNLLHIMSGLEEPDYRRMKNDFPLLFIKGEQSGYIQSDDIKFIYSAFKNVAVQTIPDAGHWLHVDQPRVFYRMVTDFFKGTSNNSFASRFSAFFIDNANF
jgi:esterase